MPPSSDTPAATVDPAPGLRIAWRGLIGYALATSGAILFSTKAVVVKLAYDFHVDAETLLALRMGFSLPIYVLLGTWTAVRQHQAGRSLPAAKSLLAAAGCGLLGYWLASYTDFIGLLWISATFERLILFTYPLMTVVFGWMFFGGRLHWGILPSFVISYAGLGFVFTSHAGDTGSNVALGAGMVLVAAIAFALYQLFAKKIIAGMGSDLFTAVAMGAAAVLALAVFFATHRASDLLVARQILPYAAFLAIGATILPSYLLNAALARISAEANGAIGMISPVATIVLAAVILGERLSFAETTGTVLVLAGVILFVWGERRQSAKR